MSRSLLEISSISAGVPRSADFRRLAVAGREDFLADLAMHQLHETHLLARNTFV